MLQLLDMLLFNYFMQFYLYFLYSPLYYTYNYYCNIYIILINNTLCFSCVAGECLSQINF